jgi:hypothetical protein
MPYRAAEHVPEPDYKRAWRRYRLIRRAPIPIVVVALLGWLGLWGFEPRWVAWVLWGVGNGGGVLVGILVPLLLFLFRCPRCGRRGISHSDWIKKCPHCGLPKFAERPPDDGWQPK